MKTLAPILLAVVSIAAYAQNFEGTIRWSMEAEITDPRMKAQMEQSKKMKDDPAMQAQLKQFQEQMKDPKMKEMMESNPQMKAQMEKIMQMSQTGDMSSMIPKGFTVKIKGMNSLTVVEGGMMEGEILYLHDKKTAYQLDRENKTYMAMPKDEYPDDTTPQFKVAKTSESKKILDYICTKYIVQEERDGKKMQSFIWATKDIQGLDYKNFSQGMNGREAVYFKEIDGVPIRIEMTSPEATMTMQVVDIRREPISESVVSLPSGYTEKKDFD